MWTYVGQILNFIVFVGVLYYLLYKPVGRILRERKEKQDEALRKAEQLRAEADEIRAAVSAAVSKSGPSLNMSIIEISKQ